MGYSRVDNADDVNIITTWEIPFQRIVRRTSQEHQDAVDLMHILAFMHFEAVPEGIFQHSHKALTATLTDNANEGTAIFQSPWNFDTEVRLRRAIVVLSDHSIIDYEPTKSICSMHPVIHHWARDRLTYKEQKHWLQYAMRILAQSISPHVEPSGRSFRAQLLPHINACLRLYSIGAIGLPETIELAAQYERFSYVFIEQSFWTNARKWQEKAIAIHKRILGSRSSETIRAQRNLGQTLWNLFEIRDAITVQVHVLNTLRWYRPSVRDWIAWPIWKPSHIPYCIALDDLTRTLWLAGKRELSKMVGERAVAGLRQRLGSEDPRTLTAVFNLARTYLHLGEHDKSHQLLVQVLRMQKHYFGLHHPDTLMTRNEVGISLCSRRRHLHAAQRLIENVLQDRKRILGTEHAYTLWSVNDLSKIYVEQGRPAEAVKILEDIAPIVIRTLGEKHVGMLMTRSNLGKAYYMTGQYKEAEDTIRFILSDIPEDHPDYIHNLFGYAWIKFNLGATNDVEELCLRMLDIISTKKIIALDSPRTIAIGDLLIKAYRSQGREKEAEDVHRDIPGTGLFRNEDHADPYAVRKGSGTSLSLHRLKSLS